MRKRHTLLMEISLSKTDELVVKESGMIDQPPCDYCFSHAILVRTALSIHPLHLQLEQLCIFRGLSPPHSPPCNLCTRPPNGAPPVRQRCRLRRSQPKPRAGVQLGETAGANTVTALPPSSPTPTVHVIRVPRAAR